MIRLQHDKQKQMRYGTLQKRDTLTLCLEGIHTVVCRFEVLGDEYAVVLGARYHLRLVLKQATMRISYCSISLEKLLSLPSEVLSRGRMQNSEMPL